MGELTVKTLDEKLSRIRQGNYTPADFIIADAKDADMGFGATGPGPANALSDGNTFKTKLNYLQAMRDMCGDGLIDIMLMSASSAERLHQENVLPGSSITPAIRYNDTTDIWLARGSTYRAHPSQPFRSALMAETSEFADLGLYSMTFSNSLEDDLRSLKAYREFRQELIQGKNRHFLEVFNPAFDIGIDKESIGFYINDMIVKTLAGVTSKEAPLFLKIEFNGYAAMNELANYDPGHLIVGILGGSKGTTRDTFELVHQAEQAGARVALFGRKINLAESPVQLVSLMRKVIKRELTPEQAVKTYHEALKDAGIESTLSLTDDLEITDDVLKA